MTYYYLYEIRNLINGKLYIGVHQTANLDDGYMGSGVSLRRAHAKYGIEHFEKRILRFFDSAADMFQEEALVVNEEFLDRDDVYNLRVGGAGGSRPGGKRITNGIVDRVIRAEEPIPEGFRPGVSCQATNEGGYSITDGKLCKIVMPGEAIPEGWYRGVPASYVDAFRQSLRRAHVASLSDSARAKRKATFKERQHAQGNRNSQYGTRWITDGVISRKIKRDEAIPEGWFSGRRIKKQVQHLKEHS